MPFEFRCGKCGATLSAPDEQAGTRIPCPQCGTRVKVPAPPAKSPPRLVESRPVPQDEETADAPLLRPMSKIDFEDLIDMTAMVDIVFFLLIFFLVTSMHALDSSIPMPTPDPQKSSAGGSTSVGLTDSDVLFIRIDANDAIWIEGVEIRTREDLLFKLRQIRNSADAPEKIVVLGNGNATHGTTVMCLDCVREIGVEQVQLAMQDEND